MPTNEERKEVAQKLRNIGYLGNLNDIVSAIGLNFDATWRMDEVNTRLADLIEPEPITGETSDGYHTFNELYDHRAKLFSVIIATFSDKAWKSKKHNDGTMFDDMFIVGIETPEGQATYHYDIDPYWNIFKCREVEKAPEWDGHTSEQVIERISKLNSKKTCEWIWGEEWLESSPQSPRELQWANWYLNCGCWDGSEEEFENLDDPYEKPYTYWQYCPYCGKKVKRNKEQLKRVSSSGAIKIYEELLKGLENEV